ncbi:unnamed protein product [Arctogadus glacialis]
MLVHHKANHPVFLTTAKDTSYDVGKIREALPERYRHTLYSYIASLAVIPYHQFLGLANQLCSASSADKSERAMDVFSDIRAKKSDIPKAAYELFKIIFRGNPSEDLED